MSRNTGKRERDRNARYALTFGLEAAAVRQGPCVAMRNSNGAGKVMRCNIAYRTVDDEVCLVWDPAHVKSVGAGGGRFDLVSLCRDHHAQQHMIGIESFGELYGIDMRALADEQALAHEPPLGVRGLAARWVAAFEVDRGGNPVVFYSTLLSTATAGAGSPTITVNRLVGYDLAALLSWARRRMAAYVKGCADIDRAWSSDNENDRDDMVTEWMSLDLEIDTDALYALCALAGGWPS